MRKRFKNITVQRQQNWIDKHEASKLVDDAYIPFWTVHDVRSSGVKCKLNHFKEDRVAHLLSQNEVCQFMLLAYDKTILTTKEQYALPLDETLTIARELDVKHPVYPGSKVPIVQTVDFMCTTSAGATKAVAVKLHIPA